MSRSLGVVLLSSSIACVLFACPNAGLAEEAPQPQGTPGVVYGPIQATKLEMPGGPKATFSVYTVTSKDGKGFQIHGANHTGHTLLNASDVKIDLDTLKLVPETTFKIVYTNTTNKVGKWSGQHLFGAISNSWTVESYTYSARPPKLPGDGQTINLPGAELKKGKEAVWINFGIPDKDSITFLLVLDPPFSPPPAKEVKDVETLVEDIYQAFKKRETKLLLQVAHVPWFHQLGKDKNRIVKTQEELHDLLTKIFESPFYDGPKAKSFKVKTKAPYQQAKKDLPAKTQEAMDQVANADDELVWVVAPVGENEPDGPGFLLLVGHRNGKLRAIGFAG